jgi:hypothetical protein
MKSGSGKKNEKSAKDKPSRLRIRKGFEHLAVRHTNRYPETEPDADPENYSKSLDSLVSAG